MTDSSVAWYGEREHLIFADVEKLSKDYTDKTEFKGKVKCYRVVGNDYAPKSKTGANQSYVESYKCVFSDMLMRHNTHSSKRRDAHGFSVEPISFSIIYKDLNREGFDISGKRIQQHFFLIMQVSDKFYILDASGRDDRDNERIMFNILCSEFSVPPQNIYSNSANYKLMNLIVALML